MKKTPTSLPQSTVKPRLSPPAETEVTWSALRCATSPGCCAQSILSGRRLVCWRIWTGHPLPWHPARRELQYSSNICVRPSTWYGL